MKLIFRKFIFFFTLILLFFGCKTTSRVYVNIEPNADPDTQFNISLLMKDIDTTDIFFRGSRQIKINNPYKNKGALALHGSMHNHTNNSQRRRNRHISGKPITTAKKFRDKGKFDFYTFTEHDYITYDPGLDDIIWMGNSLEDTKRTQHLAIYNLPTSYIYENKGNDIHELIEYYKSLGALVSYCHPDELRHYQDDEKILSAKNLDFVEVLKPNGNGSERAFDLLLSQGQRVFGIGADDYHTNFNLYFNKYKSFREAYIVAFAEEKEKSSIWKAILSGCFYASSGADIDINFNNGTIEVSSNKPSTFEFIGLNAEDPGNGLRLHTLSDVNEASYEINGNEGYVRVKVTNQDGVAFSQPFVIL